MAQKFILLSVLWLVVAIFATSTRAEDPAIPTTDAPTTPTTDAPTTPTTDAPTTPTTGTPTTPTTGTPTTPTTGTPTTPTTGTPTTPTTGTPTTPTTTTPFKDPCNPNPCGTGSTCQALFDDTFECLCLAGDFYNNKLHHCEHSKAFPGKLGLPNEPYHENMKDHTSKEFKKTADKITAALESAFSEPYYSGSVVLELLALPSRRIVESRNDNGVTASVQISFAADSPITLSDVEKTITNDVICESCSLKGGDFKATDLCANNPCDEKTTECKPKVGAYDCACKEGYVKTNYSTRMCTVACSVGEELKDNQCIKCSFGYSGFNCSENWKLILVIVGCVLGGLLLIALILLPVVATQKSNKSFKKHKSAEMEKPYTNQSSASQPMASNKFGHSQGVSFNGSANGHSGFQNAGVSIFPRAATTTNSTDNRINLEMNPSNGRQNFGRMNSGSRIYDEPEDVRPYAQARPQSNPYAQNQPKVNPYNQNQGHSNPYYTHDDGRRYY